MNNPAENARENLQRMNQMGKSPPDPGKLDDPYSLKKARNARRKRLEIRRLKSEGGDLELAKRVRREKVQPSCKNAELECRQKSSETDRNLPIGILVSNGEACGEDLANIPCLSHGSVSVCGRRREMEDAVTVAPGLVVAGDSVLHDFFGVYDGHGGSQVAHACRDRMHRIVAREVEMRAGGEVDWKDLMEACFAQMDSEILDGASAAMAKTIGSTAVVAMVRAGLVVVANCGDSRAVISRGGVAVPMSRDHKPDRPDEMERVEAAGGRVINWDGYRVLGVLATSRSIGDHYLKPYVISEPEVVVTQRTERDEFLILASDGLWDVVTNEMACEVTRRCLAKDTDGGLGTTRAAEAAALLAELAMGRGSRDNISVVVVELSKPNGR